MHPHAGDARRRRWNRSPSYLARTRWPPRESGAGCAERRHPAAVDQAHDRATAAADLDDDLAGEGRDGLQAVSDPDRDAQPASAVDVSRESRWPGRWHGRRGDQRRGVTGLRPRLRAVTRTEMRGPTSAGRTSYVGPDARGIGPRRGARRR